MKIDEWIEKEKVYQDNKIVVTNRRVNDYRSVDQGDPEMTTYWQDITTYVRRATIYGMRDPRARQAIAKGFMVYRAWLTAIEDVIGEYPDGGVPSGEINGAT